MGQLSSLWEDLPPDLVMRVLRHLPQPTCMRFRAVCKGWKEAIDSPEFLHLCSEMWTERPWFVMVQRKKLKSVFMCDPRDVKWYNFPLSFLPAPVVGRAAAGSLLCVEEREEDYLKALYVCDPLARTWFKLPATVEEMYWGSRSVTLMVDEAIGAFKVYVGCNDQLQVFDSLSCLWTSLGQSPVIWSPITSSVLRKNCLYSLAPKPGYDIVPQPYQLLRFNLDEKVWSVVNIQMPNALTAPHLAEHEGRIVMVGGMWKKKMMRSLRIWELNRQENSWLVVARAPDELWDQLALGSWNTSCAWRGEWICIASDNRVLLYNFQKRTWILSPPSSADSSHGALHMVFPFHLNPHPAIGILPPLDGGVALSIPVT